jgi:hypothetical protein
MIFTFINDKITKIIRSEIRERDKYFAVVVLKIAHNIAALSIF